MTEEVVTYDSRSFRIDGKPFFILSGSVHYIRVHPTRWADLFQTFVDAHLNTVETYVFWSAHEPRQRPDEPLRSLLELPTTSDYDFSGRSDLWGFVECAAKFGLKVILRLGPYVCAEVSYGGFPYRLREEPGIKFRTWNAAFTGEVERWVRHIASELRERKLVAGLGGPVILVQLENEYEMVGDTHGKDGAKYLQWMADLQKELDLTVPGIMCYGAADGVVETINAFYAHKQIDEFRGRRADQPPVWTECWTGWYDVWGVPHHTRSPQDLAYAVARFVAAGGAGVNYYMWMGGTNWGREGMYLQKSSYDYDAPVDQFYRPTDKARLLEKLHELLVERFVPNLETARLTRIDTKVDAGVARVFAWKDALTFVCNDGEDAITGTFLVDGKRTLDLTLGARSVQVFDSGSLELLLDSGLLFPAKPPLALPLAVTTGPDDAWKWTSAAEPLPTSATADAIAKASGNLRAMQEGDFPAEQLELTQDGTDYAFYTARFVIAGQIDDNRKVKAEFLAADCARVFIDGQPLLGKQKAPWEDRFSNKWTVHRDEDPGFCHRLRGTTEHVKPGCPCDVTIMVGALGLVKGDWQLKAGAAMQNERKGLLSDLQLFVADYPCRRISGWTSIGGTHGEAVGFPKGEFAHDEGAGGKEVPRWWRTKVEVKRARSWVIDLGGMGKGTLWVNGTLVGRYWSIVGTRGKNGFLDGAPIEHEERGVPCQTEYHVPGWIAPGDEEECELNIVLFEELGNVPEDGKPVLKVVD